MTKKTTVVKGIRKAVGDFNHHVGGAIIYMNKDTGEVWTNIYPDGNSWDEYENKDIVVITKKGHNMNTNWDKIKMVELKDLADRTLHGENIWG